MFCVECGQPLAETQLPTEDRPRLVCAACGYIHYLNPKVVSGTLPIWNGAVWLLRRAIAPRIGYWSHPAGYQEIGESTEEAAIRETWEEITLPVRLTSLHGVYSHPASPVVNVVYLAAPVDPSHAPRPGKESLSVAAFLPDAIPWAEIAFPSTRGALEDWVRTVRTAAPADPV